MKKNEFKPVMRDVLDVLQKKGYDASCSIFIWIRISGDDVLNTILKYMKRTLPDGWVTASYGVVEHGFDILLDSYPLLKAHNKVDDKINELYQWATSIDTADNVLKNEKKEFEPGMRNVCDVLKKKGYNVLRFSPTCARIHDTKDYQISEYMIKTLPAQWKIKRYEQENVFDVLSDSMDNINYLYQWADCIDTAGNVLNSVAKEEEKMRNEKCVTMVDIVEVLQKKGYDAACYNMHINIDHTQRNVFDYIKETLPFQWKVDTKYVVYECIFDISLKDQYLLKGNHDIEIIDLYKWALEIVCAEDVPATNIVFGGPAIQPYYNPFGAFGKPYYGNSYITDNQFPEYVNPFYVFTPLDQRNGLRKATFKEIIASIITGDEKVSKSAIKMYYGSYKKALKVLVKAYCDEAHAEESNKNHSFEQYNNYAKEVSNMDQYGVITEQGDLGLGFNPLDEKSNKIVNESVRDKINKTKENENDEK